MQADAISAGGAPAVTGAIRQASRLTGASFQYLLATAQVESNLNPNAEAKTSSAGGLFQFVDQTWLSTLKQAGPAFGYGQYANAIGVTESGQYVVTDPSQRDAIMQLRTDPTANALMAGIFTRQNTAKLAAEIGRPPSEGELYMAHFLGAAGAAKLIGTAGTTPQVAAADLFPSAAATNPSIFYDRQGAPRSAAQVYAALSSRFDTARAGTQGSGPDAASPVASSRVAPELVPPAPHAAPSNTPGVANAYAAATVGPTHLASDNGPVFHSLFQTNDLRAEERRDAVAPVVSRLWAPQSGAQAPAAASPAGGAIAPAATARAGQGGTLSLFQTQATNASGLFGGGSR